jgi:hypothetical protein
MWKKRDSCEFVCEFHVEKPRRPKPAFSGELHLDFPFKDRPQWPHELLI